MIVYLISVFVVTSGEYESEHNESSSLSDDHSDSDCDNNLSGRDCSNTKKHKRDWKSEKEKNNKRNRFNCSKTNNDKSKIRSQDENKKKNSNSVKARQKGKNQINNVVVNGSNNRRSTPSTSKYNDGGNDCSTSDTVSDNTSGDDKDTNKRKKIQNKWNKNEKSKSVTTFSTIAHNGDENLSSSIEGGCTIDMDINSRQCNSSKNKDRNVNSFGREFVDDSSCTNTNPNPNPNTCTNSSNIPTCRETPLSNVQHTDRFEIDSNDNTCQTARN